MECFSKAGEPLFLGFPKFHGFTGSGKKPQSGQTWGRGTQLCWLLTAQRRACHPPPRSSEKGNDTPAPRSGYVGSSQMMPEPRATTTSGPCAEVWAHAPSGAGAQSTILHSTRFWAGHMFRWFSFTCEKVLPFHWFLYSTHIRWVLVPGVVGAVTTGCSPFPLGPCDRFPGGLHAFRLEPPACRGLAYLQPAVPTVGRGSALSPLQTGRLSWSFLLEQKRMVRKKGRAGLGRRKPEKAVVQKGPPSSPHFQPPVDMAPERSGGQGTLSGPLLI